RLNERYSGAVPSAARALDLLNLRSLASAPPRPTLPAEVIDAVPVRTASTPASVPRASSHLRRPASGAGLDWELKTLRLANSDEVRAFASGAVVTAPPMESPFSERSSCKHSDNSGFALRGMLIRAAPIGSNLPLKEYTAP